MGKREIRNILDMRRNSIVSVIFVTTHGITSDGGVTLSNFAEIA